MPQFARQPILATAAARLADYRQIQQRTQHPPRQGAGSRPSWRAGRGESRSKWAGGFTAQRDRIFVADGNQYFNRPGPRIVESLEILGEIFHPELFPSRYEGKGLMRYAARPTVKK